MTLRRQVIVGLDYFLQQQESRGKGLDTIRNYKRAIAYLLEWMVARNMQNNPEPSLQNKYIELGPHDPNSSKDMVSRSWERLLKDRKGHAEVNRMMRTLLINI
jgi:hypothetical protein